MDKERSTDNRRKSYRCSVAGERQEAELVVGDRRIPVRLQDESAGGFAVVAAGRPPVDRGATLQLQTASGWFEVRVVRVTKIESTDGPEEHEGMQNGRTFCLGLQRLRDVAGPDEEQAYRSAWRTWLFPWRGTASHSSMLAAGIFYAVLLGGIPVAAVMLFGGSDRPAAKWVLRWGRRALDDCQPSASWKPRPGNPAPATPAARLFEPSKSENNTPQRAGGSGEAASAGQPTSGVVSAEGLTPTSTAQPAPAAELLRQAAELPGPAGLILPEVAEHLSLSEAQQRDIRSVVERTIDALVELNKRFQQDEQKRLENRQLLLEKARQEALRLLTDEQRNRWTSIAGQGEEDGAKKADRGL